MNRRLANAIFLVFLLWTMMFSPWTGTNIHFWGAMLSAAVLQSGMAFWYSRKDEMAHPLWEAFRHFRVQDWLINIALSIGIAAILWGLTCLGRTVVQTSIPLPAYPPVLLCMMMVVMGLGEEIFWRGYVQPRLGFVYTTLLYAGIYAMSMDGRLIVAAGIGGLVWGGICQRYPHYYPAVVISHALWNITLLFGYPL